MFAFWFLFKTIAHSERKCWNSNRLITNVQEITLLHTILFQLYNSSKILQKAAVKQF